MITTPRVGHALFVRASIITSILVALSLAVLFTPAPFLQAAGTNLVANGDFEVASEVPSAPQGWQTDQWGTISATFTYPVSGSEGSSAAKVEVTSRSSGDAKWYFDHLPVTTGTTYEYRDEFTANVATQVDVEYLMSDGSYQYTWLGDIPATGSGWSTFSAQFTPPTGAVSFTVFHLIYSVGTLAVDSVSVVDASAPSPPSPPPPPPPQTNLINNGDLEQGGGSSPVGWHADYWGNLKRTFTYPVAGSGGGSAARVVVRSYRSGDAKWWFDHVPVSSHKMYRFSNEYTANVVTNVSIEFRMQNGSYQYQWLADLPATGGSWKTFTTEVTVPTGAQSMTVLHSLVSNGALTIDNATLVELPPSTLGRGMVTLVFDDGLASQFSNARSILSAAGITATFGIITEQPGNGSEYMSWSNITTLSQDGHEIAGHTRTHADLTALSGSALQSEVQGSFQDLVTHNFAPQTFLYPYGAVNGAVMAAVQAAGYQGARGSYWGLNSQTTDRWALYDIRVDKSTSAAYINTFIDQAAADKRWLVLELHDVLPSGGDEYSITPSTLQQIVNYLGQANVDVVTLADGLQVVVP